MSLWATQLASRISRVLNRRKKTGSPGRGIASDLHAPVLTKGIAFLDEVARSSRGLKRAAWARNAQVDQPFDRHLLDVSPLYRRSRELYLKGGGKFHATLVSSPRTLSSPILLEQTIEYSPIEPELVWAATDARQKRETSHLMTVRTYAASLFHEQSHRLLWRILPPPGRSPSSLRRYLNFVESLVITLDMALGDELGPSLAATFYLSGVVYDPGTKARADLTQREYRNYLQAALHATYLNLEGYDPKRIPRVVEGLFPGVSPQSAELARRAGERACQLDRGFVERTNPVWQKRHSKVVRHTLSKLAGTPLELPSDPMDYRMQYLFAERWFEEMGL